MHDNGAYVKSLNAQTERFRRTGVLNITGLTLGEVLTICQRLGIDPGNVVLDGERAVNAAFKGA